MHELLDSDICSDKWRRLRYDGGIHGKVYGAPAQFGIMPGICTQSTKSGDGVKEGNGMEKGGAYETIPAIVIILKVQHIIHRQGPPLEIKLREHVLREIYSYLNQRSCPVIPVIVCASS